MVLKEIIKNKKGEVLTTKEGVELVDYKLEKGDIFIPVHNSILTKSQVVEVEEKGKKVKKTIVNYKLKCKVIDIKEIISKEEEIFISLTPTQAKSLNKKISEGVILNQHLYSAYTYTDSDGNEWIGVGFKTKNVPAKSFDDFEDILTDASNEEVVDEEVEETDTPTKE